MLWNPFSGYCIARALILRRSGRVEEAVEHARRAFKASLLEAPSFHAPVLLNAFYADLCGQAEAGDIAYEAARTAIIQIDEINTGTRRGKPRKAEDQWFILYWMRDVLVRISPYIDSAAFELALAIPANYGSLNLERTDSALKDLFPVEREWALEMDAWVEKQRQALAS